MTSMLEAFALLILGGGEEVISLRVWLFCRFTPCVCAGHGTRDHPFPRFFLGGASSKLCFFQDNYALFLQLKCKCSYRGSKTSSWVICVGSGKYLNLLSKRCYSMEESPLYMSPRGAKGSEEMDRN